MASHRYPVPENTQGAAVKVGCSIPTLWNYVRQGYVTPPRTQGGDLMWFDPHIEAARKRFKRHASR